MLTKDDTQPIDKSGAGMTHPVSDKLIRDLERAIKRMDANAVITLSITRGPFSQVDAGQKCVTCGFVNQAETEACVMCETVGQVVLTIKRGTST